MIEKNNLIKIVFHVKIKVRNKQPIWNWGQKNNKCGC